MSSTSPQKLIAAIHQAEWQLAIGAYGHTRLNANYPFDLTTMTTDALLEMMYALEDTYAQIINLSPIYSKTLIAYGKTMALSGDLTIPVINIHSPAYISFGRYHFATAEAQGGPDYITTLKLDERVLPTTHIGIMGGFDSTDACKWSCAANGPPNCTIVDKVVDFEDTRVKTSVVCWPSVLGEEATLAIEFSEYARFNVSTAGDDSYLTYDGSPSSAIPTFNNVIKLVAAIDKVQVRAEDTAALLSAFNLAVSDLGILVEGVPILHPCFPSLAISTERVGWPGMGWPYPTWEQFVLLDKYRALISQLIYMYMLTPDDTRFAQETARLHTMLSLLKPSSQPRFLQFPDSCGAIAR